MWHASMREPVCARALIDTHSCAPRYLRTVRRRAGTRIRTCLRLELAQALLDPRSLGPQPLNAPRQLENEVHAAFAPAVIDRLSLRPLHIPKIRRPPPRTLLWEPED